MKLSVIIVNYNVKEYLQNLLYSLDKAAAGIQYEVIIVDNASDDGSVELLKDKFPYVKLIVNDKNLGFGKANNIGLALSKGEFILLINPDTIIQEDTLTKLLSFFKLNNQIGLAGCKILNPDGTLQLACRRSFPGPWTSFCKVTGLSNLFPNSRFFARYNLTYLDENKSYEVDAISGSFMMMRRKVYEIVGGFDEQFFMYGEDLDLCFRVQKAGFKNFYVHDTQIIHYKGESTRRSNLDETRVFYNAMHLFVKKHLSSSFIVELILRSAINFRKIIAFAGRKKNTLLFLAFDFLLFDLSLYISEKIYSSVSDWKGFPENDLLTVFTLPASFYVLIALLSGDYKKDKLSVLKNLGVLAVSFILLTSLTFFFKQFAYSRAVVIILFIILFFTLSIWRIVAKLVFKIGWEKDHLKEKRTLIVGTNELSLKIASKLKKKYTDFHTVAGLISASNKEIGQTFQGFEVLGSIQYVKKIIGSKKINEVIFSSELSYNQMMEIVSDCQNLNVEFKIIGDDLDFIVGKTKVSLLDDLPLIELTYSITNPLQRFMKRAFDICLSTAVLFSFYPLIYFISKLNAKETDFRNIILQVPSVFKGTKSFVGPAFLDSESELYLGKPGLTGFWFTEDVNKDDVKKLNILYAKNQNIWLDLEIIGRTITKIWSK